MKMSANEQAPPRPGVVRRGALAPGMRLFVPEKGTEAGWITSATRSHSLGKEVALGY